MVKKRFRGLQMHLATKHRFYTVKIIRYAVIFNTLVKPIKMAPLLIDFLLIITRDYFRR